MRPRQILCLLLFFLSAAHCLPAAEPLQFRVQLDKKSADKPITGRLYVFLSKRTAREPRFGPSWFNPEPFFAIEVRAMKPGETRTVGASADACPVKLSKLPKGEYRVQALLDHDFYTSHHGRGVGNLYSEVRTLTLDPASSGTVVSSKPPNFPSRSGSSRSAAAASCSQSFTTARFLIGWPSRCRPVITTSPSGAIR